MHSCDWMGHMLVLLKGKIIKPNKRLYINVTKILHVSIKFKRKFTCLWFLVTFYKLKNYMDNKLI